MERVYQNYSKSELDSSQKADLYRAEFFLLLELLSPRTSNSPPNLFSFVLASFHQEKRYEFEVKRLPENTQFLIESRRFDNPILLGYFGLLELGHEALSPDGKRLLLSIFELYVLVLISSMRRFLGRSPADLKTQGDYFRDDFELEFLRNPYLVLLRRYLEFFFRERRQPRYGKMFKTLLFLLQDFTINDFIFSPIAANELERTRPGLSLRANTARVPKPHVFQAVFLVVHFFLRHSEADAELRRNDFLASSGFFAKSLYHFLINVLAAWSHDLNNSAGLLSFPGRVWLAFLRPWDIMETNSLPLILARWDAGAAIELFDFGMTIKETSQSKELTRRENAQFIAHFLKENVLFYTHVLAAFFGAFADQGDLHFKDVLFLKTVMDFLLGPGTGKSPINSLFGGFISVTWLRQLVQGPGNKLEGNLDVMQYLDFMGAKIHSLTLFNDDALLSRVLKTIANLTRFNENFKKKVFIFFWENQPLI